MTTVGTETDLKGDYIKNLVCDNQLLREQLNAAKAKCEQSSLDEGSFVKSSDKVLFYTGLPNWNVLSCVLTLVSGCLSQAGSLTPFQQLLLTLMKLRLNLTEKDLAYRFGVSVSSVSRTFLQVLNVLYAKLKPLIIWPDRDALQKTMPMCFKRYCNRCVVIIDCFELFVDRPLNPLARAETYSSYKHHNTVKFLIGITPQGTVSFISDGWGGRVSDKHITQHCNILDNLVPGDVILADRGFDIQEAVGFYCATVKIPAFTKGKKQLSGIEVEQTRRIANVRIHVERIIGLIKNKYLILSASQPIDFMLVPDPTCVPTLDKLVTVCCALVNISVILWSPQTS
ncbi:uncharacterized protein LOC122391507 [Amphibalanus amphitrite]|uniref:uncharacterized protein LOC122391507 n=1 Tax=Amphibalanus amphitrite TaxID=1232801 RepID=UPI001C90AD37|nr:uncharacterized protein LOC122391507 [Amphibalanus amphitrite]